jgi:hypothetical protein
MAGRLALVTAGRNQMKESEFSILKAYLEKEAEAVPIKQFTEKTGITPREIAVLVMNGVIYSWYKLTSKDAPVIEYTKSVLPAYCGDVEKLVAYMSQEGDKIFRQDELKDALQLSRDEALCIMSIILGQGLFEVFYSLVPSASCEICFYRERSQCNNKADKPCQLFRHDWRLGLKKEG